MKMRISFHRIAVVWAMTAGNKKNSRIANPAERIIL